MKPHTSYRHEALLHRGDDGFVDSVVPFVREGVRLGQPVMVAVVPRHLELLRAALGEEGDAVHWVDMSVLGANPARIIPAWRRFVDEHGGAGRPVRGVGEPVWAGRGEAELAECQLHEALLNLAVEPDTPLWLVCPYDAAALPDSVLEEAGRSHPALVDGDEYSGSTAYAGAAHVEHLFRQELPEPAAEVEELLFDGGSLDVVRLMVQSRADQTVLSTTRTADLTLAVAEAAGNSVRHAGGRGRLRVWQQDGALVCEVRDDGRIEDPMVGRRLPSLDSTGGRGMWLISQLSDLSQVRSTAAGTAVRVTTRLS